MRGMLILVSTLAVAGCASKDTAPLAALVGAPQKVAFDMLGEPLHQRKDGALMRSLWRVSFVSMAPAGGREWAAPPICEVLLAVDPQGVIAGAKMRGDAAACERWKAPLELAEKVGNVSGL